MLEQQEIFFWIPNIWISFNHNLCYLGRCSNQWCVAYETCWFSFSTPSSHLCEHPLSHWNLQHGLPHCLNKFFGANLRLERCWLCQRARIDALGLSSERSPASASQNLTGISTLVNVSVLVTDLLVLLLSGANRCCSIIKHSFNDSLLSTGHRSWISFFAKFCTPADPRDAQSLG